ncbi:phosphocholine-specific phospholipase C [Foetidibacter luteolus]|uniref:phosphocholine-specific phospholipase C n=1 Tax=Foetidibacter luteolus TaxID=2608880 RepID=UPI0027BA55BE|nr:phospholipase C, phosphocholine-specific [Foetidibacter luteolus]
MMDSRREFLKKAALLSGGAGLIGMLPPSVQKALAIDPAPGTTFMDAEHIVFLMQENRSFDHCFGTLQGVRGFNDPRAINQPNKNKVWLQTNDKGETYAPFRLDIKNTKATWMSALPHNWGDQVDAANGGKMDGWLEAKRPGNPDYFDIPMTMGYYTREDIPFYYSLADAFTVCDQHFCSSLTGTTPNRLYFWTGNVREDATSMARVRNEDTDYDENRQASWTTFPERLEENGVSWKIYQNELSVGVGFEGEQDAWLANFTDNPIEWFKQYNVKLSTGYINWLQRAEPVVKEWIEKLEKKLVSLPAKGRQTRKTKQQLKEARQYLVTVIKDKEIYTLEKYNALSDKEKSIHNKAFTVNSGDPFFHQLTALEYDDAGTKRQVEIPKGDVLHQFRQDVKNGSLPTVSWLVAPENFSDHPGAPWYGAWYLSEVLDILTQNPEVWKKTIFILTYDENDGCFDHVPPFLAPHPVKENTGLVSSGIDTAAEFVTMEQELKRYDKLHPPRPQEPVEKGEDDDEPKPKRKEDPQHGMRESPIGLGFRVPMLIASPWSRGGRVCSEVFDHTSCLQFLETFLSHKLGKRIQETNISQWRRTVCGNLTSAFKPYNGEKTGSLPFEQKEAVIESIHKAKFKNLPDGYKNLAAQEIEQINLQPQSSPYMPAQEKGTRSSCALPYELYVDGRLNAGGKMFEIDFAAGKELFGDASAGAPYIVYAPGIYRDEALRCWNYAVTAGDKLTDNWAIENFEGSAYHLQVYGPNGFFREFKGTANAPLVETSLQYERVKGNSRATGNLLIKLTNKGKTAYTVQVKDEAYKTGIRSKTIAPGATATLLFNLVQSHNWYDFSVTIKGHSSFTKRYAGKVETGKEGITDPLMGGVV